MNPPQTKRWRMLRRCLVGLAVCMTLIGLFYTEENWRGKHAWENCKRELEAKGIKMEWAEDVPAPVPDDQNVLAAPEMQKLFFGKGATELSERIPDLTDVDNSNRPPIGMVVADVVIGLPGVIPPGGFTVLTYGDQQAKEEASRLIKDAIGPYFIDQWQVAHNLRRPEEIQPAKIWLRCQTAPTTNEWERFLSIDEENAQIEPSGNGSFRVTLQAPTTVADILASNAPLEPEFTLMRQALQRPYARMLGDYQNSKADLEPTFAGELQLARWLGTLAQCHLLEGQPEEALRDLTLGLDLLRIQENLPGDKFRWGLLVTLIHETVAAIDTSVIADGLRWHTWREPQLAVLQEQLKQINFVSDLRQHYLKAPAAVNHYYENITPSLLGKSLLPGSPFETNAWVDLASSLAGHLIPRGWVYQNMVQLANGCQTLIEGTDSSGQMMFPKKEDAAGILTVSHVTPYNFMAIRSMRIYSRHLLGTAKRQTMVHEALIACALERYRLAHGEYPETLGTLVPQFIAAIPKDVIGGQPPHYNRATDGKFILYSIGWSGRDGGGVPGKSNEEGDWVWSAR